MNTPYLGGQSLLHRPSTTAKPGGLAVFSLALFAASYRVVCALAGVFAGRAVMMGEPSWRSGLDPSPVVGGRRMESPAARPGWLEGVFFTA